MVSPLSERRIVERQRLSFHFDEVPKKSSRGASTSRSREVQPRGMEAERSPVVGRVKIADRR